MMCQGFFWGGVVVVAWEGLRSRMQVSTLGPQKVVPWIDLTHISPELV